MSMTQTATGGKAAVARKVAAAAAARTKKLLQAHGIPVSLGKYEPLGMTGEEELSRPFVFRLEARFPTATPEAIVAAVLGKSMALELAVDPTGTTSRFVHGQVFAIARDRVPGSPVPDAYVFSIRPRLSRLAFSADSRVFTEKTVRQVVEQVFADARVPGPTWLLRPGRTLPSRPVTVQYRESDLEFVSRLLEEEGLTYFFEHTTAGHKLVITDHAGGFASAVGTVPVREPAAGKTWDDAGPAVHAVRQVWELGPAGVEVRGRATGKPDAELVGPAAGRCEQGGGIVRETGCEIADRDAAVAAATARMAELDAAGCRVSGSGTVAAFAPGWGVTLDDQPAPRRVLLTRVRHDVQLAPKERYHNQFDAHPIEVPYVPPRTHPRPAIPGPVAAVVTARGEEHGRVKVKFEFDRTGVETAWLPVAHPAGVFFNPQIGQRVRVTFAGGDPDRPEVGDWWDHADTLPFCPKERADRAGLTTPHHHLWFDDGSDKRVQFAVAGDLEEFVDGDAVGRVGKRYGLSAGEDVVIAAGKRLVIQVGGSFIVIDESGVTIKGPKVKLNPPGGNSPGDGPKPKADPKAERKKPKKK